MPGLSDSKLLTLGRLIALSRSRDNQAWPKVPDSGSGCAGIRGFKSSSLHLNRSSASQLHIGNRAVCEAKERNFLVNPQLATFQTDCVCDRGKRTAAEEKRSGRFTSSNLSLTQSGLKAFYTHPASRNSASSAKHLKRHCCCPESDR